MGNIKRLLGLRIRELRKARSITQEQPAEMIRIGTANISYIEIGKFAPSIETFEKIVKVFDVEPFELYTFEHLKPIEEISDELFTNLKDKEDLLRLVYKFYLTVR